MLMKEAGKNGPRTRKGELEAPESGWMTNHLGGVPVGPAAWSQVPYQSLSTKYLRGLPVLWNPNSWVRLDARIRSVGEPYVSEPNVETLCSV